MAPAATPRRCISSPLLFGRGFGLFPPQAGRAGWRRCALARGYMATGSRGCSTRGTPVVGGVASQGSAPSRAQGLLPAGGGAAGRPGLRGRLQPLAGVTGRVVHAGVAPQHLPQGASSAGPAGLPPEYLLRNFSSSAAMRSRMAAGLVAGSCKIKSSHSSRRGLPLATVLAWACRAGVNGKPGAEKQARRFVFFWVRSAPPKGRYRLPRNALILLGKGDVVAAGEN